MAIIARPWFSLFRAGAGPLRYSAIVLLALVLAMLAEGLAAPPPIVQRTPITLSAEDKEFVRSLGRLKVMADENYAPLSFFDEDAKIYRGISVDLLNYLSKEIGLDIEFIRENKLSWNEKIELFNNKEIDILLSASITSPREQHGVFTSTYYNTHYGCVAKRSRHIKLRQLSDITSYKVGTIKKTAILAYTNFPIPPERMVLYDTSEDLYQALSRGDIDIGLRNSNAFFEERVKFHYFDLSLCCTITEFPTRYGFYLTNTPDNIRIAALLDRGLGCLDYGKLIATYERGEDELIIRYLEQRNRTRLLAVGIGGAVVLALVSGWAYLNHRRISRKLEASLALVRKHQEELESSRERYQAYFEGREAIRLVIDPTGGAIVDANQAAVDFYGYPREKLLAMTIGDIDITPEQDMRQLMEQAVRHGGSHYCLKHRLAGGEIRDVESYAGPLHIGARQLMQSSIVDVTELRRLAKMKEDVEHIIRHDIRSPLQGLIHFPLALMVEANITQDQRESLGLMAANANKVLRLINDTLMVHNIENGEYQLVRVPCDPRKIVRDNAGALLLGLTVSAPIAITEHGLAGETGEFRILTDPAVFDIAVANVLRNAVEADGTGDRVRVDMRLEDGRFVLEIANARPVPEPMRARFFEKYATFGKPGGTGLGTYSAAIMMRALGGTIAMETSDDTGTTVTMRLPTA